MQILLDFQVPMFFRPFGRNPIHGLPFLLWLLLSPDGSARHRCRGSLSGCRQASSGKVCESFLPCTCQIYSFGVRTASGFVQHWELAPPSCLLSGSCPSRRDFAYVFLRLTLAGFPLTSASGSCCQARRGLPPPRFAPCRAHNHYRA